MIHGEWPTTSLTANEVAKKLAEWATEPCDSLCAGILCRHERARHAVVEIRNAIEEIEGDRRRREHRC